MRIIFLLLLSILLNACKTDVDVLADWKETAIVYGLLNQSDTAHYIRINKAFLGEGNALQMAQVEDSINYADLLNVRIERVKNGSVLESYTLSRDTSIQKDPGMFSYPSQALYKFKAALNDDSEYRLDIYNSKSGNHITASTTLVGDFLIDKPYTFFGSEENFTHPKNAYEVVWKSSPGGRLYDVTIRFHYTEVDLVSGIQEKKYADWYLGTQKTTGLSGGQTMEIAFLGEGFYKFINGHIPENPGVKRIIGKLDFLFSVAADEFNTYLEVNQPSTGILQEKPDYTNVENGLGIFSARYNKNILDKPLNSASMDSLCAGQYTCHLGFCYGGFYSCTDAPFPCN